MQAYIYRITHDKAKLGIVILLLALPMLQAIQVRFECSYQGASLYAPMYATFQSLPMVAHHIIHRIYMWFMPLYLLFIFAEPGIEDAERKITGALICRCGRRRYILGRAVKGFILSFVLLLLAMMINLLLCEGLFRGGTYTGMDIYDSPENALYNMCNQNPFVANIAFDFVTAFICGLICTVGVVIGMLIADRKIVYGITLMLWIVPIVMKRSLMLIFQPFSEYDFKDLLPIFLTVTTIYMMIIVIGMLWRLKNEEL